MAAHEANKATEGLHRVGPASSLPHRLVLEVPDEATGALQRILLLRLARGGMPSFLALAAVCYHAGGRLDAGRLAVYDGRVCITCPVHHFELDAVSGERVSRDVAAAENDEEDGAPPAPRVQPPRWRGPPRALPGGPVQRVHSVEVVDGVVYVRVRRPGDDVDARAPRRFLGASLEW
jgi:nitrite reductase/ring-hydroxylating ferredoxin subunit